MSLIANNIKNISIYLLPMAAFFLLISSAGTNFFLLLSVIASIFYCVKNKGYKVLVEKNILKLCFAIYFLFLISIFYSAASIEEITEILKKYVKFVYIPFLYYLIKIQKNGEIIINFFIYGVSLILILSYLKFFNIVNFEYFYNFLRETNIAVIQDKIIDTNSSIFQNYIIQGVILSFYSFLCLYLANINKKFLYYALSFFSFTNVMFLNDSRSAYIIMMLLMIFSLYKIITNNKGRVVLVVLCVSIFSTQLADNLKTRMGVINDNVDRISQNNYNSSLGYRYMWFKIGVDNIFKAPLLGLGAGSYRVSTIDYFNKHPTSDVNYYVTNNPHNEFLSISSQLGSVGLFLFFGFLFYLFKDSRGDILSRGVFVVVAVSSLFNSAFYDNMLGLFIVILVCLSSQDKFRESTEIE